MFFDILGHASVPYSCFTIFFFHWRACWRPISHKKICFFVLFEFPATLCYYIERKIINIANCYTCMSRNLEYTLDLVGSVADQCAGNAMRCGALFFGYAVCHSCCSLKSLTKVKTVLKVHFPFSDGMSGYLTAGGYYAPAAMGLQGLAGHAGTTPAGLTAYAAAAGPTVSQAATAATADGRLQ